MRPEFALAQNNLGTSLRELGETDEAMEAFARPSASIPHWRWPAAISARCWSIKARPKKALAQCREAVRLDPGLAAGHNNLGNAYRALQRWTEAARRL